MIDLTRLAALAEAATPGPWKTAITDDTFVTSYHSDIAEMYGDYDTDYEIMEANAAYIAAADPTTILAMIRRLQAAEAELLAALAGGGRAEEEGSTGMSGLDISKMTDQQLSDVIRQVFWERPNDTRPHDGPATWDARFARVADYVRTIANQKDTPAATSPEVTP